MRINQMLIGGQWVDAVSGKTFPVLNPSNEEILGNAPLGAEEDVDRAVRAAMKAFTGWAGRLPSERSKIINRMASVLRENANELIDLEVNEHGTPIQMARGFLASGADLTEYTASISRAVMGEVIPAIPNTLSYLQRVPVGVCAAITPWNVPFLMMVASIMPAIAVGNTCVLKPASINSLIGIKFAEILEKADIPPGLINLVTGPGGSVGHALASHSGVDLVRFTGSSETGKGIMTAAGQTVKKLILELGGNNPVIVYDDANVTKAAESHAARHFGNSAQNCSTPGRYYVHERVYDEFVEKFVNVVKKIKVGDPRDEFTVMGPMSNSQQRDKVEHYIRTAVEEGAKVVYGGHRPSIASMDKGYFLMPTVVANVTHEMTIAREEIFGPAAPY